VADELVAGRQSDRLQHGHRRAGFTVRIVGLAAHGRSKAFPILNDEQFTQFPASCRRMGDGWRRVERVRPGEVYVTPFPGLNGKWRLSTSGGSWPRWGRDGKEVFFLSLDNPPKLMVADVDSRGSQLSVGAVHMLFETRLRPERPDIRTTWAQTAVSWRPLSSSSQCPHPSRSS
jgi:hypothetical protein